MGARPSDLADLEEPSKAAAVCLPASENLDGPGAGSSTFFLDENKPPKKPSFSFSFFVPAVLTSAFLSLLFEKKPPFFSFSFLGGGAGAEGATGAYSSPLRIVSGDDGGDAAATGVRPRIKFRAASFECVLVGVRS